MLHTQTPSQLTLPPPLSLTHPLTHALTHSVPPRADPWGCAASDYFGRKELVELKANGANIRVTEGTKREYVDLVAQHRMTTAIKPQIQAFLAGFWDLIPKVGPFVLLCLLD